MNGGYAFPLSASGRHLVDAAGKPFFFQADTLWMFGNIRWSREELSGYLDHRVQMGFSVIQMMTGWKAEDEAGHCETATDADGNLPFTEQLSPGIWRLDRPCDRYFGNLRWLAEQCAARGLLLLIAPLWLGAGRQGFARDVEANGEAACFAYGQFLGRLLGDLPNVGWIHGGDRVPNDMQRMGSRRIMDGIKSASSRSGLHTAHWRRPAELNLSREIAGFDDLDLEMVYSASVTYYGCLRNWQNELRKPTIPAFMGESYYEGQTRFDLNGDGKVDPWPRHMCRRQAYWSILCGAGHSYGVEVEMGNVLHRPVQQNLDLPGTHDMRRVRDAFIGRPWHLLEPDATHEAVTAGYGTRAIDSIAAHADDDYVTAATTRDGTLLMAYLPPTGTATRALTVNMDRLSGKMAANWYNPATGAYSSAGNHAKKGLAQFTTPGDNGTGQNDWLLVIEPVLKV